MKRESRREVMAALEDCRNRLASQGRPYSIEHILAEFHSRYGALWKERIGDLAADRLASIARTSVNRYVRAPLPEQMVFAGFEAAPAFIPVDGGWLGIRAATVPQFKAFLSTEVERFKIRETQTKTERDKQFDERLKADRRRLRMLRAMARIGESYARANPDITLGAALDARSVRERAQARQGRRPTHERR